jgi:hypothetical protein
MYYCNPDCVYIADDPCEAALIVAVLAARRIPAQTPTAPDGGPSAGVEVCVVDPGQIEAARRALVEHAERTAAHVVHAPHPARSPHAFHAPDEPDAVQVRCEECGRVNVFSGDEAATPQNCGHCGVPLHPAAAADESDALTEAEIGGGD